MFETTLEEALTVLADPNQILTVQGAEAVCRAFEVKWSAGLVLEWGSKEEAFYSYGISTPAVVGQGVNVLQLGLYLCDQLEVVVASFDDAKVQAKDIANRLNARLVQKGILA